jgi:hypothetical protein
MTQTVQLNKVTIDRAILGDKRGDAACKLIADHVFNTLKLTPADTTTHVCYWDSGFWNVPASICISAVSGKWNGGFRDKVSGAINGRVTAPVDTNASAPVDGTAPAVVPVKKYVPVAGRDLKVFVASESVVSVYHNDFILTFERDASGQIDLLKIPLAIVSTHGRKIQQIASELESVIRSAVEVDASDHPCVDGWQYGLYATTELDHDQALGAIIKLAVDAQDYPTVMTLAGDKNLIVRNQTGKKYGILPVWFPPKPETTPAQPSETPAEHVDGQATVGVSSPDMTQTTEPVGSSVSTNPDQHTAPVVETPAE